LTIGKLLKITPEQTHAKLSRLRFADKVKLLRKRLAKSDYPNAPELDDYLNRIQKSSMRNVFAALISFL
jgi:hypothetical protein